MARVTSRAGYWIGGGLIVAGVVGAILWGVLSFLAIDDTVDDFARAPAPGWRASSSGAQVHRLRRGPRRGPGLQPAGGDPRRRPAPRPGRCRSPATAASLTYSMSGHSGRAQGTVTPRRAGIYELRAATTAAPSAGFAVALGDSIAGRIVRTILGAFAIGGLLLAAGVALIVTTGVRRRGGARGRRRRRTTRGWPGFQAERLGVSGRAALSLRAPAARPTRPSRARPRARAPTR